MAMQIEKEANSFKLENGLSSNPSVRYHSVLVEQFSPIVLQRSNCKELIRWNIADWEFVFQPARREKLPKTPFRYRWLRQSQLQTFVVGLKISRYRSSTSWYTNWEKYEFVLDIFLARCKMYCGWKARTRSEKHLERNITILLKLSRWKSIAVKVNYKEMSNLHPKILWSQRQLVPKLWKLMLFKSTRFLQNYSQTYSMYQAWEWCVLELSSLIKTLEPSFKIN